MTATVATRTGQKGKMMLYAGQKQEMCCCSVEKIVDLVTIGKGKVAEWLK